MKHLLPRFFLLLTATLLPGAISACQSCLFELTRSGILRGVGERIISNDGSTAKHRYGGTYHASSVVPIGVSSRGALRASLASSKTGGIDHSAIGFLAVRKFITLHNTRQKDLPFNADERSASYTEQVSRKLKRIMYSESESETDETIKADEEMQSTKSEEDGEIMSQSMIMAIGFYKQFISPLLPPACRFLPTCSQYGVQAIKEFGPTKGVILTAWRLARCSPIGGRGKLPWCMYSNTVDAKISINDFFSSSPSSLGYDPPKWPPVAYNYGSY